MTIQEKKQKLQELKHIDYLVEKAFKDLAERARKNLTEKERKKLYGF